MWPLFQHPPDLSLDCTFLFPWISAGLLWRLGLLQASIMGLRGSFGPSTGLYAAFPHYFSVGRYQVLFAFLAHIYALLLAVLFSCIPSANLSMKSRWCWKWLSRLLAPCGYDAGKEGAHRIIRGGGRMDRFGIGNRDGVTSLHGFCRAPVRAVSVWQGLVSNAGTGWHLSFFSVW